MQRLRCTTGHIGIGGDIYSTGDIFEVADDVVAESVISSGGAVLVDPTGDAISMAKPGKVARVSPVEDETVVAEVSDSTDTEVDSVAKDAIAAAVADVPIESTEKKKRVYKRRT